MKILVLNSGSSSIKYQLFDMAGPSDLASGVLERIGEPESRLTHRTRNAAGGFDQGERPLPAVNHREGFMGVVAALMESGVVRDPADLFGIGHRVVHGGEIFHEPTMIEDGVVSSLRAMIPLAPLHNGPNLLGIEVALELCPGVPQVAVFDTAFHQSMPPAAFRYALPRELYTSFHVRRYGFHGTSHRYVARRAAALLGKPLAALDMITLHLGNGASATAIRGGKSVDTSMGMTPLEGLVMGTRSGDLDPAILIYLARTTGKSPDDLEFLLNHESGLKGLCGSNDMREVHRLAGAGDREAELAIDMFCYRIKKYIGAYYAVLGRLDALVFAGGIGENDVVVRKRSCEGLAGFGIGIDDRKNKADGRGPREIQEEEATVKVLVIPTDEELEIAEQTAACISKSR